MPNLTNNRKLSKSTAASKSTYSSGSSCDEDIPMMSMSSSDLSSPKSLYGCWCPKCESFFKQAESLATKNGFKLCGEIYSA